MGLLEDLRNYTIALEADDIRKEAANASKSLLGNTNEDDVAAGDDGNDDITRTEDIFGIEENKRNNGNQEEPSQDQQDDEQEQDQNEDPNAQQNPDDQQAPPEEEQTPEDDNQSENMEEDSNSTPDYYDKNKLKENMIYFYNIIMTNTVSITELTGRLNEQEDIDLCNRISNNLRSCSKILYDDLTKNIDSFSYEELKRDYVTIKRVFDLCNEMLYKHFGKDSKDFIRLKKKSK